MTYRPGLLALLLALAGSPAQAQPGAGCAFSAPDVLDRPSARWYGPCRSGTADGSGVLRSTGGGYRAFYGIMKGGEPVLGVVEGPGGYRAGRFAGGKAVPSSERQDFIEAFRAGAEAADALARSFRTERNAASAKFYADKANALRNQLD